MAVGHAALSVATSLDCQSGVWSRELKNGIRFFEETYGPTGSLHRPLGHYSLCILSGVHATPDSDAHCDVMQSITTGQWLLNIQNTVGAGHHWCAATCFD